MAAKLRSASLKVDRAAKHIEELNELLREKRPFRYILETDTKAGERSTYAERDEAVVDEAAVIAGDALHGLRSALDHAYWAIASPVAADARAERAVQFPFSETAARLEEAVKNRLAHRVSPEFFAFIMGLQPHGEAGGNELLYLLHEQQGVDKHRTLIPTADYTRLSGDLLRRQVPDFPANIKDLSFGGNFRDLQWPLYENVRARLGIPGLPLSRVLKQELDVPVEIVFRLGPPGHHRALVPTLYQLAEVVNSIIRRMERFA